MHPASGAAHYKNKEMTMQGTAKGVFVISFMLALATVNTVMAGTIEGTVKNSKSGGMDFILGS